MKQIKVLAAVAVAGLMMMASCAKENKENTGNDGMKSVKIRIAYDQTTRAEGAPVAHETQLTMAAGHIFFATPAGLIERHVGIANSAGSETVDLAHLNGGEAVIEDISGAATRCYILSNEAAAGVTITGNLEGQNISAVLTKTIAINSLNDATGGVTNIPLYGVGNVTADSGSTPVGDIEYEASVEVTINTLAARYQIAKISGKTYDYTDTNSDPQTVTIDEFTVEGIYINYFNEGMTVGSTLGALVNNGGSTANYATTGSTVYAAGEKGEKMADYLNLTSTAAAVEPSTSGNVWAYNVFPGATVPHIVIRLSEVKFTDSATALQTTMTDQFITVGEFKYATGHPSAGTVVASLAANNIYTFNNIQFNYTNLSAVPETEKTDVLVTVDMMEWLDNDVEWSN